MILHYHNHTRYIRFAPHRYATYRHILYYVNNSLKRSKSVKYKTMYILLFKLDGYEIRHVVRLTNVIAGCIDRPFMRTAIRIKSLSFSSPRYDFGDGVFLAHYANFVIVSKNVSDIHMQIDSTRTSPQRS